VPAVDAQCTESYSASIMRYEHTVLRMQQHVGCVQASAYELILMRHYCQMLPSRHEVRLQSTLFNSVS
jgi:hypothetical protein